jgi:hypothetical protein
MDKKLPEVSMSMLGAVGKLRVTIPNFAMSTSRL